MVMELVDFKTFFPISVSVTSLAHAGDDFYVP